LQTRRCDESVEGLNSSLKQSTGDLRSYKDLANVGKLYLFLKEAWTAPKVLKDLLLVMKWLKVVLVVGKLWP